jgi:hypothetical protein
MSVAREVLAEADLFEKSRVRSVRSDLPTLPAPSERESVDLSEMPSLPSGFRPHASGFHRRAPAEWCVDLGSSLETMSTFELWTALSAATIPRHTRVWREGMECWTPALEVDELACAVLDAYDSTPSPSTVTVESDETPNGCDTEMTPPPTATERPTARPSALDWAKARPVVVGSACAVASVVLALASTSRTSTLPPPTLTSVGVAAAIEQVDVASSMATIPAPVASVAAHAAEPIVVPQQTASRHSERGQKRLRTGKRP